MGHDGSSSQDGPHVRMHRAGSDDARSGVLGARLAAKLGGVRVGGANGAIAKAAGRGTGRPSAVGNPGRGGPQRVIVKVSFAPHRAGSGKLAAHAAYLGRDGAARDGEQGRFYDANNDRVDELGHELGVWSREDPRHFRIIIAPESAARLEDLDGYVREVMARMERDLGIETEWVAINHWNTDNPHAHIILRGRSLDGRELRIPRAYLSHGLRHQAREIATGLLGERCELDDRLTLDRAVKSRGLTSLDRTIAASLEGRGEVLVQELGAGENSLWADALRGRARELASRGLAIEVRRNVLAFRPGWQEVLQAAGPLDITKAHGRELKADYRRTECAKLTGEIVGMELRDSGNTVLALDTGGTAPVLVNTLENSGSLAVGSWLQIDADGRFACLSRHSLADQLSATAFTELDRELSRIGAGEARVFAGDPRIDAALKARASDHVEAGFGTVDEEGRFQFVPGARPALEQAEMAGLRQGLRDQGFSVDAPGVFIRDGWTVRAIEDLHQGPVAILQGARGNLALVAIGEAAGIEIGQSVGISIGQSGSDVGLQMVSALGIGSDLSR
ncbi:MAG: hypothetical protein MUF14_02200 [Hyphomonadaceae bacterium]|nr:hypothetical protein [Hyphomonadaceae bacterium]